MILKSPVGGRKQPLLQWWLTGCVNETAVYWIKCINKNDGKAVCIHLFRGLKIIFPFQYENWDSITFQMVQNRKGLRL